MPAPTPGTTTTGAQHTSASTTAGRRTDGVAPRPYVHTVLDDRVLLHRDLDVGVVAHVTSTNDEVVILRMVTVTAWMPTGNATSLLAPSAAWCRDEHGRVGNVGAN
jgi:hypothetical protein